MGVKLYQVVFVASVILFLINPVYGIAGLFLGLALLNLEILGVGRPKKKDKSDEEKIIEPIE